jgi:hypothetical protein
MSSRIFAVDAFELHKGQGDLDLVNDTIKVALLDTFSPSYSAWAAETSYSEGDIVVPTSRNGRRYRAKNDGTSDTSEPSWPTTDGEEVSDNDITWEEYGGEHADNEFFNDVSANEVAEGDGYTAGGMALSNKTLAAITDDPAVTKWASDDVTWTSLTKSMRLAWIYVDGSTPGTDDYLLAYVLLDDAPADVSVSGVDFKLQFNTDGILHLGRKATL